MTKMNFENKTLERMVRSFKWARNNSLQILDTAQKQNVMNYQPDGGGQHTILYQFQCLATTTDTYYRKLINNEDKRFGIIIRDEVTTKTDIVQENLRDILTQQVQELEKLLKSFTSDDLETNVQDIQSIINHEYLHQGQLVVMFRSLGIALPERFRSAFDL
ncbi:MAG TPA: hypothetical protein VIM53_00905 [Candidatus Saccharimonadales bacterium]